MVKHSQPDWLTAQAYAHRGLHSDGVPENSLAAFAAAIKAGLGIECDVHKSIDGRAIVFHDEDLERLTGQQGSVAAASVGELTALHLCGTDERIPTLRDLLAQVAGRVPILLELKTDPARSVIPLCRSVRRDLDGYTGPIAVMSFDARVAEWFASQDTILPRGLVITEQGARTLTGAFRRWRAMARAKPDFLAYDVGNFPSRFAARQRKAGKLLLSWTVRNAAQLDAAIAAGATPIIEGAGVKAWRER